MLSQLRSDVSCLRQFAHPGAKTASLSDRLDSFYQPQSAEYDSFRERLLRGRRDLLDSLPLPIDGHLIDMGGGTGSSLDYLGARLHELSSVTIVDLCEPLLRIAQQRVTKHGWPNVCVVKADATSYEPPCGQVDAITFSYSLTMIPNWIDAVEHAYNLLRPGGHIGVVDFYVSQKWVREHMVKHSKFTRFFWPMWFSHSNVFLNPAHLELLHRRFRCIRLLEKRAPLPYMLGLSAPYYSFIGEKPAVE
jgi:S-adenosylmethionine-diacylgycerolhomoserine-N-methlytransferase